MNILHEKFPTTILCFAQKHAIFYSPISQVVQTMVDAILLFWSASAASLCS
jgi:hypothetical protein